MRVRDNPLLNAIRGITFEIFRRLHGLVGLLIRG